MCSPNQYLRPNEIRKSNEATAKLLTVIESHFLNPFDGNLVRENLYNLVSGMSMDESTCDSLTWTNDIPRKAHEAVHFTNTSR